MFNGVLDKFKKNGQISYEFLLKASEKYKDTIFSLCKRIIVEETIPNLEEEAGDKEGRLGANWYIHCKDWLARTVEAMIVKEMDPKILQATNIFLIGGKHGHRP